MTQHDISQRDAGETAIAAMRPMLKALDALEEVLQHQVEAAMYATRRNITALVLDQSTRVAVEDIVDGGEHDCGLTCASHYDSAPCDCWKAALRVALGPQLATAEDVIEGRARYADTPGGHADRKTKRDEDVAADAGGTE